MSISCDCPECKASGLKSRVTPHGGSRTLMRCSPYYDEDGVYHHHDTNITTSSYSCSNGHEWTTKSRGKCPAPGCEFGGKLP